MEPPHFTDILPDAVDDVEEALPSFATVRRKTWETIYSDTTAPTTYRDKSPKGSVDKPIQLLVNLINFHPSFATLSSCSGRIALYDTLLQTHTAEPGPESSDAAYTPADRHGKGSTGGWRLASHTSIDVTQVLDLIQECVPDASEATDYPCFVQTLSFEPMLLHVAAANLKRGRQLLQAALQMGFRESGLIVTDARITVAIRSYSLAWQIPLDPSLPKEYLRNVLDGCNERLQRNHAKMNQLCEYLHKTLFQPRSRELHVRCTQSLPPLNLWAHAAVMVPNGPNQRSLLVFGGYGTGPMGSNKCQRSSHIYCLMYHIDTDMWSSAWECVDPVLSSIDEQDTLVKGISIETTKWSARQGLTASFHKSLEVVLIFGGRKGPGTPLQDLVLFDMEKKCLGSPLHVLGKAPSPRWGHSMTEVSDGSIVIVGGRDESTILADVHVLSFHSHAQYGIQLQWTELDLPLPSPLCFHSAVAMERSNQIFVWGGTTRIDTLLADSQNRNGSQPFCGWVMCVEEDAQIVQVSGQPSSVFGHTMVPTLTMETSLGPEFHFLCIGGAASPSVGHQDIRTFSSIALTNPSNERWLTTGGTVTTFGLDSRSIVLLHHATTSCSVEWVSSAVKRLAVVGGGVQGFSFGQMFADCFALEVELVYENEGRTDSSTPLNVVQALDIAKSTGESEAGMPVSQQYTVPVFYVEKRHAKSLKQSLETQKLLDKRFKLCPADPAVCPDSVSSDCEKYIAVPVVSKAIMLYEDKTTDAPSWTELVHGLGNQKVMLSSSMFARR